MTHDIMHCNYADCPAKDRCMRDQAHIKGDNPFALYIPLDNEKKTRAKRLGSCIHFELNK